MKNQQIERKRITQLVSAVLMAVFFSSMLWAADGPEKPGSSSPVASTENAETRQAFYVRYARGRRDEVRQAVADAGGRRTHELPSVSTDAVMLPEAAAEALSRRAGVELVEPVPEHRLAGQAVPYNIDQYQARDIWDADRDGVVDDNAPDGSGVKFCIIDTGLYAAHDDFVGVTMDGHSQISGEAWSEDGNGHGTHVAGTANAVHNDLGVVGTMPGGAEFFIVKFFNNDGNAVAGESNLAAAAAACRDAGANVISMSLGGGGFAEAEADMFQDLYDNDGILNIAAAGNDGNEDASYPASYDSVISVAAIDSAEVAAEFSQHPPTSYDPDNPPANTEWDVVEFSGGGVNVLSTWPGSPDYADGSVPLYQVTVDGTTYEGTHVDESGLGDVTGPLVDGGLCDTGDIDSSWNDAVVLCERGDFAFADKVNNVRDGGGLGAIIYNNEAGDLLATCGGNCTTPLIPAIGLTQADGQELVSSLLGDSANLVADDGSSCTDCTGGYNAISGTSMATPGVAAAVALTWDACGGPAGLTNKQIRQLLRDSAKDLTGTHPGTGFVYGSGWDQVTGWGLVKLADARELGNQLYGSTCPIGLEVSPATLEVCGATDDSAQTTITLDDAFEGSATMSASGIPSGASGSFSPNPVDHPTKDTDLTLSGLGSVASGTYDIEAIATDDDDATNTATAYLTLDLDAAAPGQVTLQSPADSANGVSLKPSLSWSADSGANEYLVEIATDSGFSSIVHSANVTGTSYDVPVELSGNTTYYWRVTAANHCGSGAVSLAASFTTTALSCQQFDSTDVPLAITDASGGGPNVTPETTDSTLSSTLTGPIYSVSVIGLQGTHTYISDLSFDLIAPDSTTVRVMDQSCAEEDDFHLSLADDASGSWPCPPTDQGTYPPSNPLSGFQGLEASGDWTLRITDHGKDDSGTLDAWALNLCVEDTSVQTYTLTYTADANGTITGDTSQTVDHGDNGTQVEAIPDTGYHFVQWSDSSTANPRTDTNVTSDITVEAQHEINSYTVDAAVASGNGSIDPASQSVDHDGTAGGTLSADTGWSLDTLSGDTCSPVDNGDGTWSAPNITDACAVTATFVIDSYTVSAAVGSGNGSIGPGSQSVDHDGTAGGTLSADAGWSLDTLSGDTCSPVDNGDGTWSAPNITEACAVTATFVIDSYTVSAAVGSGNGSIGPGSQSVDHDGTAGGTLSADTGWSLDT
uniref:S8 family serine peptidase n=1 Tax=Wenzhouxiangella sp. EGI_FJ10305 TaxID=3243768 RepID=UPI0035DEBC30